MDKAMEGKPQRILLSKTPKVEITVSTSTDEVGRKIATLEQYTCLYLDESDIKDIIVFLEMVKDNRFRPTYFQERNLKLEYKPNVVNLENLTIVKGQRGIAIALSTAYVFLDALQGKEI